MATIGTIAIGMTVNTVSFQKSLFKASDSLKAFSKTASAEMTAGVAKIKSAFKILGEASEAHKAGMLGWRESIHDAFENATSGAKMFAKGMAGLTLAKLGGDVLGAIAKNLTAISVGFVGLAGLAGVNAFKASIGTAVELEKTMTGLSKATDLEGAGLESMKTQLFNLSTELKGIPLDNLIAIATEGAKQGVANNELMEYTKGIAMVSVAMDDIPVAEMASGLGKINSVFKLGVRGAKQMGSAIDKLADSGLSGSADILDVTSRISGTAEAMHLGAPAAVALATSLLDTGTQAEAAGGALKKLMLNMIDVGKHASFAETMGISVKKFSQIMQTEPIQAIQGFLTGLKKLDAAGQKNALAKVGIKGTEGPGELMKLAQQADNLGKYLGLAKHEFQTMEQAQKSYNANAKTTDAIWTQFNNHLEIIKNTFGEEFLPTINSGLEQINWALGKVNAGFKTLGKSMDYGSVAKMGPLSMLNPMSHLAMIQQLMGNESPAIDIASQVPKPAINKNQLLKDQNKPTPGNDEADEIETVSKKIKALNADLRKQAATFGMSSAQIDVYKLKLEGASTKELESAQALANQVDAMEAHKKALADGQEVLKSSLNPFDQFIAKLVELDGLLKAGAITWETYNRSKQQAFDSTDIGQYERELRTSIATIHMSADQTKLYELSLTGVSKEQLKTAESLAAIRTGMTMAKDIFESTRTPLETYFLQLEKIDTLSKSGLITDQTAKRGRLAAQADLGIDQRRLAGAAEFGSVEAASTILSYQGADSGGKVKEAIQYAKEQTEIQRKLLEATISNNGKGTQTTNVKIVAF